MTVTVRIDTDRCLVVARFSGAIDFDDIMGWLESLRDSPDYHPSFMAAVDLRAISLKQTRPDKAEELARHMVDSHLSTGRWAVIVSGPVATALTVLYQAIASTQHPIGVFSTRLAAAEFLGCDLSTDLP
ncbi:MAG: hypothetical protein KDH20_22170 [Rhodocyclaceae bacterium]|nr:hypothetical protein [Rhodocyclaceae bacterium]